MSEDHSPSAEADPHRLAETGVLAWLAERRNVELSYNYGDESEGGCWNVHRVTGGANDREWELIGTGETPTAALQDAITKGGDL